MKIFLGLPVYGAYNAHFVHSLLALAARRPRPFEIVIRPLVGESHVGRARNRLAAQFLASDCTHLLFIDTDIVFSPEHIARLASHSKAIVAGLYPKKQLELDWVYNCIPGEETRPDGLQRVKYAGTGCLMIARHVFEEMRVRYPEIEYDPDDGDEPGVKWDFFSSGVWTDPSSGRRRWLSEDWYFCQRAQELGFGIWMDTEVALKHVGEFVYPVQPLESFATPIDTAEKVP
jgi:hypothetical protein